MSEDTEADDFDDEDDVDDDVVDEGLDVDRVMKDMEIAKRRAAKSGEPAWRRLERRMEQKLTAELISDFEDYDIGDDSSNRSARKHKVSRAGH